MVVELLGFCVLKVCRPKEEDDAEMIVSSVPKLELILSRLYCSQFLGKSKVLLLEQVFSSLGDPKGIIDREVVLKLRRNLSSSFELDFIASGKITVLLRSSLTLRILKHPESKSHTWSLSDLSTNIYKLKESLSSFRRNLISPPLDD